MNYRDAIKDKKRIVVKIGSSSLTHKETGHTDLLKLEQLVRVLTNITNQGKEVILVSSGAIPVGKKKIGHEMHKSHNQNMGYRQACAAIGQAQLMMMYQKLFSEYNQISAQILMTKDTMIDGESRINAQNTFEQLLEMNVIPIVNENDTISVYEIEFGDNDRLSAIVAALVKADLLILLSDIDGLFTDDPNVNQQAEFISVVTELTDDYIKMGKDTTGSSVGTGGMSTKLMAANIATNLGVDMVIANGEDVSVVQRIIDGEDVGTLFVADEDSDFHLLDYLSDL